MKKVTVVRRRSPLGRGVGGLGRGSKEVCGGVRQFNRGGGIGGADTPTGFGNKGTPRQPTPRKSK